MLSGHPHRVVVASLNICRWGDVSHPQMGREWQSYDPGVKQSCELSALAMQLSLG